jgi:hypothetical protein
MHAQQQQQQHFQGKTSLAPVNPSQSAVLTLSICCITASERA